MDLRAIANNLSSQVNPNIPAVLFASTGYTKGAGQRQVPTYAAAQDVVIQLQALDSSDLNQLDGLNIQGQLRAVYIRGALNSVVRVSSEGGDKLVFAGQTWLVTKVLETWPLWTKAAITLQVD